ncbi:MAG: glycerophosphodiester phosphodiesterase family protein [Clostridia bacterium]|nr:glycerophosphodiester phosphodiesterase family protein [Clostridia bacterium]
MIKYTKLNKIIKLASVLGIVLAAAAILLALAGCTRKVDVSGVKINGVALNELRIFTELTGDTDLRRAEKAEELSAHVNTLLTQAGGKELELAGSAPEGSPAFIFTETAAKGYDDYTVRLGSAGQVLFEGGSKWALKMAFSAFLEAYVLNGKGIDAETAAAEGIKPGEPLIDYTAPDRDAYINDPSLLPLHWRGEWTPPAEMLDYDAKVACLERKENRHVFTASHRGDWQRYPENSIEAIISVWAMDGDCVEIDLHFTKDKVPVVLHDSTLSRTTDFADKAGKNGLPESDKIGDWTLEQVRQLRLKEGKGGNDAAVTPYLIPTLEECLVAARGRFFYILDKPKAWRYAQLPDIEELQPLSKKRYLAPYMERADNFESVLIAYGTIDETEEGTLDADEALKIQRYIYDTYGRKMYFFLRGWTDRGTAGPYAETLENGSLSNSGVIVNGGFVGADTEMAKTIRALTKTHPYTFFGSWTLDAGNDHEEVWDKMYKVGLRGMMTDDIMRLVKRAAELGGYV